MDWDNLLGIGFFVLIVLGLFSGGGKSKRPGIWSGDTRDEEARRNTRTDANYQGHSGSDRGW